MNEIVWHWPQWVYLALLGLTLILNCVVIGMRLAAGERPYEQLGRLTGVVFAWFVLYAGGFFTAGCMQ